MVFPDWRSGVWLILLGLAGALLPAFGGYAPPAGGWTMPVWPFYVLMAAGAACIGIGLYNRLKGP